MEPYDNDRIMANICMPTITTQINPRNFLFGDLKDVSGVKILATHVQGLNLNPQESNGHCIVPVIPGIPGAS